MINLQPTSENHMENACIICNEMLSGKQLKFCSLKCKNSSTNNKLQNYVSQQRRGKERRKFLIQLKGNCCEVCGYHKNLAALAFHHIDASQKSFPIDLRKCSNAKLETLLAELEKCQLLCLNCHTEIHNPAFST